MARSLMLFVFACVFLAAAGALADVDVWIKTNVNDNGDVPSPDKFWKSPWLIVDNDNDWLPDKPVADQCNRIRVKVHNLGTVAALNVTVDFYWRDPGLAVWFPYPPDGLDPGYIGTPDPIDILLPDETKELEWPCWTPTVVGHYCIGAVASCDGQLGNLVLPPDFPNGTEHAKQDNNIAQRNVTILEAAIGEDNEFDFQVWNPLEQTETIFIQMDPLGIPRGWSAIVKYPTAITPIIGPGTGWIASLDTISPGGSITLKLVVTVPADAEEGETGTFELVETLGFTCTPIGGLTVVYKVPYTAVEDEDEDEDPDIP